MSRLARTYAVLLMVASSGCSALLGFGEPSASTDTIDAAPDDGSGPDAITQGRVFVDLRKLAVGAEGMGRVISDPPGIDCPMTACEHVFPAGQQVKLSAETGFGRFGGFRGVGCTAGIGDCTFTVTGDTTVSAGFFGNVNFVFVSSQTRTPGEFDGIDAVDAFCQLEADAAGLAGSYLAWLPSTLRGPARLRFPGKSGWLRTDGQVFAATMAGLAAGQVFYPPSLDERGLPLADNLPVATDTHASGDPNAGEHCNQYSSRGAGGLIIAGEPTGGSGRWTENDGVTCNQPAHYYCFENDFMAATLGQPVDGIAMFVSKGTLVPGAGVAAADSMCRTEATDAQLDYPSVKALVSTNGLPATRRFDDLGFQGARVQRPDGVLVANSMPELLAGAAFIAPPNVSADRTQYVNEDVWTGGTSFDSRAQDCTDWTATTATMQGTVRPAASGRLDSTIHNSNCVSLLRVWCVAFAAVSTVAP